MTDELYHQVFNRLEAIAQEATELHNLVHEQLAPSSDRQRMEGVLLHLLKTAVTGKQKWFAFVDPRRNHEPETAL